MQTLKLATNLFEGLASRTKHMTIRKGTRAVLPNRYLLLVSSDPVPLGVTAINLEKLVWVEQVVYKPLNEVTDEEAQHDGFVNRTDLVMGLGRFYPNLKEDEPVTLIYFKPAELEFK
jgi:hypothetical protein